MVKPNSKYRLAFLGFALLVFTYQTVYCFYKYAVNIDKGMSLIGGITFGLMTIFYVEDLYVFIKNKKSGNPNNAVKSTSE